MNKYRDFIIKYFNHKVSYNFIIVAFIALIQAFNNIVLGRVLSQDEYGIYAFIFISVVPLLTAVVVLGQNTAVIRFFSERELFHFKWKSYIKTLFLYYIIITVLLAWIITCFYKLSFIYFSYLVVSIFASVVVTLSSSFFRARKYFNIAIFLERISPLLFFIVIVILMLCENNILSLLMIGKVVSIVVPSIILFLYFHYLKEGGKQVKKEIYLEGFLLWIITLTLLAINRVDNLFIVKYIDFKAVAVYSVLICFMQIYDFASTAIWGVYSQKFSTDYQPEIRYFLLKLLLIGLVITFFYITVGSQLLKLLFHAKYDSGAYLIPGFCLIGLLKILYIYPSCYFVGKSSVKTLKVFLYFNIAGVVGKIILLIIGLRLFGLIGGVYSGIVIWIYRNVIGYSLVFAVNKDNKRI